MSKNRIIENKEAIKILSGLGKKFLLVNNPSFIHPSVELYPLTQAIKTPVRKLSAVVMDMDGTTTTTEELCLHSLEFMVRKITGRLTKQSWSGLDHTVDFPHIIGNSTTKHVEYLIKTFKKNIKQDELHKSYIYAALWTLITGKDETRKNEVKINLSTFGLNKLLSNKSFISFSSKGKLENDLNNLSIRFYRKFKDDFHIKSDSEIVRASIDIYYQRYHEILAAIEIGNGKKIAKEFLSDSSKHLIEPMPGILFFLCLIKGLLGKEINPVAKEFVEKYFQKNKSSLQKDKIINNLVNLSLAFEKNPLKIAVVTSSIYYEADIVMKEVFKVLREEIASLKISLQLKKKLLKLFSSYRNIYDAFITASDANEIRLKPHRDLYSIALHQLNVAKKDFDKVIGFEDSESGCFAIRAAGIGICVAVPFAQTSGHNFEAATFIANEGLPEVLISKNLFLK